MIPTLLLELESDHMVLDMCSAPGSKTAQLVADLHTNGNLGSNGFPEFQPYVPGLVIANELDLKRANLLASKVKRIGSPNVVVSISSADTFPHTFTSNDGSPTVREFDRILCDVPCAGDGTLRKSKVIWKGWKHLHSIRCHDIQIKIAMRGLQLLKVGGYMVGAVTTSLSFSFSLSLPRFLSSHCFFQLCLIFVHLLFPSLLTNTPCLCFPPLGLFYVFLQSCRERGRCCRASSSDQGVNRTCRLQR